MDVKNLTEQGKNKPVALACGKCGKVWDLNMPGTAEACCMVVLCSCGKEPERKYYSKCDECIQKQNEEKEKARFDKAEKVSISDYDGTFLQNDSFSNEGYVETCSLEDELETMEFDGKEKPTYAWACDPTPMPRIEAVDIIENHLSDFHEDTIEHLDVDALQKAIDEWTEAQPKELSFFPINKVVLLNAEERIEGSNNE